MKSDVVNTGYKFDLVSKLFLREILIEFRKAGNFFNFDFLRSICHVKISEIVHLVCWAGGDKPEIELLNFSVSAFIHGISGIKRHSFYGEINFQDLAYV